MRLSVKTRVRRLYSCEEIPLLAIALNIDYGNSLKRYIQSIAESANNNVDKTTLLYCKLLTSTAKTAVNKKYKFCQ